MTLEDKLARVPDRPGVYLYRDGKQQVLYVGKAASLRGRVRSYFQESRPRDPKTDALVRQIRDLEYIVTDNELEARMKAAAKRLDFEQAAELRDRLKALRKQQIK